MSELESMVDALRVLIDESRHADAPADALARARALIDDAAAQLRPHRYEGEVMQSALRGPGGFGEGVDLTDPAAFFPYSPIVGPLNAIAPPVRLTFDGGRMRGELVLGAPYAGPPGTVHGGVIALIFDELLGCVNVSHGYGAFTGTLTVRYERRTPLDAPLRLESWIDRVERRKVITHGTISCDGEVTARAEGIFISERVLTGGAGS